MVKVAVTPILYESNMLTCEEKRLPRVVAATSSAEAPKTTSIGTAVMLCLIELMFLAFRSCSLNTLMHLSSHAVAKADPSALNASPVTLSWWPYIYTI